MYYIMINEVRINHIIKIEVCIDVSDELKHVQLLHKTYFFQNKSLAPHH